MIIFSNLWSCWFWLTIYFIALLGCTCIVRFRFHHEESLFPPSHLPQYITIQPTVLFIVLSHLGCRKAHPPHGWSSGWLQHPGNKNIWSAANIFYISSANVDPSGCARNWKIGSTPQLCLAAWLVADLCTSWSRAEQVVSIYPGFASLQIFEYKVGRRIEQLHIIDDRCNHHHVTCLQNEMIAATNLQQQKRH